MQNIDLRVTDLNGHPAPTTMIFEHGTGGHRGINIYHLLYYWQRWDCRGQLFIVTPPDFVDRHTDVVNCIKEIPNVTWVPFSVTVAKTLRSARTPIQLSYQIWSLFNHSARQVGATQGLSMYLDLLLLPLALRARASCRISGIYFRPTFHYHTFGTIQPTLSELVRAFRQQQTVRFAMNNPSLQWIFSFDPLAKQQLQQYQHVDKYVNLPDPIEYEPYHAVGDVAILRAKLRIDPGRKIFLLFGSLHPRKGVLQVINAIQAISPILQQNLCLLLVGKVAENIETAVHKAVAEVNSTTAAQVILLDDYVEQKEVRSFFTLADVILAPYIKHVGMSGVLLQAGAAGKPVLATNFGLLGQLVHQYQLGVTVASEEPISIAKGIEKYLTCTPEQLFDAAQARQLVFENSSKFYAQKLFTHLGHIANHDVCTYAGH